MLVLIRVTRWNLAHTFYHNLWYSITCTQSKWPVYLAGTIVGLSAWGLFLLHATNAERLASSPLRQITYQLRSSPPVLETLGSPIRYAPNWWGFGEPWIGGSVGLMQGKVDLRFRIRGSEGEGTVYFTSIRLREGEEWQTGETPPARTLRGSYHVIC